MDLMTCKSIEEAKAKVLIAAGYATGWPIGPNSPQGDGRRHGNSRTCSRDCKRRHTAIKWIDHSADRQGEWTTYTYSGGATNGDVLQIRL
eukprot:1238684-Pleurochrysis_carterae.AAC.2